MTDCQFERSREPHLDCARCDKKIIDTIINQKKTITMLKQFFILCSGADKNLLEGCSEGEQTKYIGIGATVFFTAVMALIASSYALFLISLCLLCLRLR